MRARKVWHARARASWSGRSTVLSVVAALLLAGAAAPAGAGAPAEGDVGIVDPVTVRVPSNEEVAALLAGRDDVRVVTGPRTRAADGALGAGIEITPAGYGPVWLGAYGPPAGVRGMAWCVQARIYPSTGDTPRGVSELQDLSLAHAEDAHADLGNVAVQAALGYLVHMRHERPGTMAGGDVARTRALIDAATPVFVRDLAHALIADGDRNAGPYGAPDVAVDEQSLRHGEVRDLGVRSASGQFRPGAQGEGWFEESRGGQWVRTDQVVVDANGNHRADPGEPSTWSGTSGSTGLTVRYAVASGAGTVRFVTRWTGISSRVYGYYDMGGNRQDVLVLASGTSAGDPVEYAGPPFRVAADFQVVPTSQVSAVTVDRGETVTDVLTTTLVAGDSWVEVDGRRVPLQARATVYGPLPGRLAPSSEVPEGTPVAETRLVEVDGPGDSAHDFTFGAGGTYAIVWSFLRADQTGDAQHLRADSSDDFMAPSEVVTTRIGVELSSEVEERIDDSGGAALRDRVSVSLLDGDVWPADDAGHPLVLVVRNTAFAPRPVPSEPAAEAPDGVEVLASELLEFTGPGSRTTGAVSTGGRSGFVTWQAEVRLEDQSEAMAERLSGPVRSPWMEEVETTSVRRSLQHTSRMQEWNVDLGGRVLDDVELSGFPEDHGDAELPGGWRPDLATSRFTVFGPFEQRWTEPVVPDDAPVLMSTELPARNGTYRVGLTDQDRIQPNLPGCYVAVWTFDGDDRVQPFTSRADDVLEHFCVRADASAWLDMVSTASPSAAAGEGTVGDTVLVLGPALPSDGVTLTWEQCRWAPGAEPGCATPAVTHTVDVPRTGAYRHPDLPTPTIQDLPPGALEVLVGWAPVLRDRAGVELRREPWGTPAQTTRVVAALPTMVSRATEDVTTGGEVTDRVVLTGATRADWTLRWELCWLDPEGACPDGTAFAAGDPVPIDPRVDTYDHPAWVVEVPAGTAPGARLHLGWAPVVTDALGTELLREDWGVAAQTTTVDHPSPGLVSVATPSGVVGEDSSTDEVEVTGPLLDGSVVEWDACYWVLGDTGCRPDAAPVAPGPGLALPALAVGETVTVTGPDLGLTDGGLPHRPGLRLSWMPRVLSPDGQVVVAETWGVAAQTTAVTFPPIVTRTEAYAESDDVPRFGDRIGDRLTVEGDIFPGGTPVDGAVEGLTSPAGPVAQDDPDAVVVRLYAWPSDGPPVCEGEPLAEHRVDLQVGVSAYDTGPLYRTPADRTDLVYGFQETTRSRGVETVSECGLASETLRPVVRPVPPALAVTGRDVGALAVGTLALLTIGVGLTRYRALVRRTTRTGTGTVPR
jgi:hypothetical protein